MESDATGNPTAGGIPDPKLNQPGQNVAPGLFADACLLATTVIWGINLLVFKYSIGSLDPVLFNSGRLLFSLLALTGCVWLESRWRKASLWPHSHPDRPIPWLRVMLFSALTGLIYLVLYLMGIARTTAGNTALLLSSMPMWTAVLSFLFLRERLKAISWIGLAVTFSGTLIVTLSGGRASADSQYFWGNLLMLSAAFTWASATVLSRNILHTMTPLQLTFIASLVTTPLHMLWIAPQLAQLDFRDWTTAAVTTSAAEWPSVAGMTSLDAIDAMVGQGASNVSESDSLRYRLSPLMLLALLYCGALSTGVAYALWNTGVKLLGGSHAAIYQNVVTLVAVVGGWLILKETPQSGQILGGLTIIAGVLLMRRGRK